MQFQDRGNQAWLYNREFNLANLQPLDATCSRGQSLLLQSPMICEPVRMRFEQVSFTCFDVMISTLNITIICLHLSSST